MILNLLAILRICSTTHRISFIFPCYLFMQYNYNLLIIIYTILVIRQKHFLILLYILTLYLIQLYMLPFRKSSRSFRERKVPNIIQNVKENQATQKIDNAFLKLQTLQKLKKSMLKENITPRTQILKNNNDKMSKRIKFQQSFDKNLQVLLQKKLNYQPKQNSFKNSQNIQPTQNQKNKQMKRTVQSSVESLQTSIMFHTPAKNNRDRETDTNYEIMKRTETSMDDKTNLMSTQRTSVTTASKQKQKRRKRLIQKCKVVKIPWKSNTKTAKQTEKPLNNSKQDKKQKKDELNLEVSMIKNISLGLPAESLRQICEKLN